MPPLFFFHNILFIEPGLGPVIKTCDGFITIFIKEWAGFDSQPSDNISKDKDLI